MTMMFETVYGEFYTNALIHAAYCDDILDVEDSILEGEIDVNDTDDAGYTALDHAVMNNNLKMAELLIENGANVNVKNGYETPLSIAVKKQNTEMIRLLEQAMNNRLAA